MEERLQNSALASIIRPETYVRSSNAEAQAMVERRAREEARTRTRESSDAVRGEGVVNGASGAGESFEDVPREDFESASEVTGGGFTSTSTSDLDGAPIDDAPRWPDEASESSFLAEQGGGGSAPSQRPVFSPKKNLEENHGSTETPVTLPPLQSLVDRVPSATREVLEDLFRARFVSVKQIQKDTLKT